jgi:hypothetical protein
MIKVVSYLAGIPVKNKNLSKPEILKRFVQGVTVHGDSGILHKDPTLVPCDVAVIQGWTHEHGKNSPHLKFRQAVIVEQKLQKKKLIVVDSNLFNYRQSTQNKNYLRYSFDGVFPTTGFYFDTEVDTQRWQQISQDHGLVLQPWQTEGKHILICTQRQGGWSMKGLSVIDWVHQTVKEIKKYSNRPIVVRLHPGDNQANKYRADLEKFYKISNNARLVDDFAGAWVAVTYNSSPGVAAAIEGIPVFVTDPVPETSQAYPVANTDLAQIESPETFERQDWLNQLCMSHWSFDELSNGTAWQHIKKFL